MSNKLNRIYHCMLRRCYCPDNQNYKWYGARGITVCDEWVNPEMVDGRSTKGWFSFRDWALSNGFENGLTIDRIDTNKGYSPDNCRWLSMKEQCNNRRSNHLITYKGKTQNLNQWCKELGLNYKNTEERINRFHWSVDKAFEMKTNFRLRNVTYKDKTQTLKQWCSELGLDYKKTHYRIKYLHWTIERAFESKVS